MADNNMGPLGAISLAKALRKLTQLKSLKVNFMGGNTICASGARAFIYAVLKLDQTSELEELVFALSLECEYISRKAHKEFLNLLRNLKRLKYSTRPLWTLRVAVSLSSNQPDAKSFYLTRLLDGVASLLIPMIRLGKCAEQCSWGFLIQLCR